MLARLLSFALKQNASDLHLSAGLAPMIRVHGDMKKIETSPLTAHDVEQMIFSSMNDAQQQQLKQQWELDYAFSLTSQARFRVNVFYQQHGLSAVFRVIPQHIPSLAQLNAPAILQKLTEFSQGLVLVTGATGSGKSTTLAAMLNEINLHRAKHIISIEDPIEFVHQSQRSLIHQRELHQHTHSFHHALRAALREDPDILLVGEMRDLDTIRLALTAAETGHLVFATLHTNSASKSIDRIIDAFPADEQSMIRTMLAESLQAVVAQSLIKSTQQGRIAAYEILINTPAVRNLIRENKIAQLYSTLQTGQQYGMMTLDQHLQQLLHEGKITTDTAREIARQPELFEPSTPTQTTVAN